MLVVVSVGCELRLSDITVEDFQLADVNLGYRMRCHVLYLHVVAALILDDVRTSEGQAQLIGHVNHLGTLQQDKFIRQVYILSAWSNVREALGNYCLMSCLCDDT